MPSYREAASQTDAEFLAAHRCDLQGEEGNLEIAIGDYPARERAFKLGYVEMAENSWGTNMFRKKRASQKTAVQIINRAVKKAKRDMARLVP